MRLITTLFLILFCVAASPVSAQLSPYDMAGRSGSPEIRITPKFPQPGETVSASLSNTSSDIYGSSITWLIDGVEASSAQNTQSMSFVADKDADSQTITAVIIKPTGVRQVATKTFRPAYIDIIVEPQTHVPSFYLGRSLPSKGSLVNLTAILSDQTLDESRLLYTWRIGRVVVNGGPIFGSAKAAFEVPYGRDIVISLEVNTIDGELVAEKHILIPSVSPYIRFYETNSLFGTNNVPTKKLALISNSTVVKATPYHLDSRVYNQPSIAEWEVDNETYSNQASNPYEITLQRNGESGTSNLEFHVRDTRELLQGAKGSLNLTY